MSRNIKRKLLTRVAALEETTISRTFQPQTITVMFIGADRQPRSEMEIQIPCFSQSKREFQRLEK